MTQVYTEIYIELGKTRVVACSYEWPGWCRYGKTAESALETLLDYAPRYQIVAQRAGLDFDTQPQVTSTQLQGNANTDWAPTLITAKDTEPRSAKEAERGVKLLQAAWGMLDDVAATSVQSLRKGPRGGGRDLDEVVQHVLEAERAYARKIGVKYAQFSYSDRPALIAAHDQVAATLSAASDGSPQTQGGWPATYAVRRMAWHVIDHIWEIEDRQI